MRAGKQPTIALHGTADGRPAPFTMSKGIVLLVAIFLFRIMLPRRQRRTNTTITPYGSVFDVAVPPDVACSALCDPTELARRRKPGATPWQDACYAGRKSR
jgi:hypothetical protein